MSKPHLSDIDLINKIRSGDHISFKLLFDRYWSELYIYAYNILGEKSISEDIVQEVFTDLWKKAKTIEIQNPRAYLYKSIKYQTISHIRSNSIHQKYIERLQFIYTIQNLEDELNFNELDLLIKDAVQKLPEGCRRVYEMSRSQLLTNKEIAEKLSISTQTVKNQISTALHHLRKSLESTYILLFFLIS